MTGHTGRDPAKQAVEGFPVIGAGEVVHEEIHRRTQIITQFGESQQHEKGVRQVSKGLQLRQEHGKQSKNDDWDGQHEKLYRQCDEHFRHGDLFSARSLGGCLSAPSHCLVQPDGSDDSSDKNDDWNSHSYEKSVKDSKSVQHSLVLEVVIGDVDLP